ncbi:MAG: hypothetical protein ACM3JI_04685, partial [Anaerolineae bacterium]
DFFIEAGNFPISALSLIHSGMLKRFVSLLQAEEIRDICNPHNSKDFAKAFTFVEEHLEEFEDFIFWFEDMQQWLSQKSRSIQKMAFLLQDFSWLIRYGDLSLIKNLDLSSTTLSKFSDLVYQALLQFKEKKKEQNFSLFLLSQMKKNPLSWDFSKFFMKSFHLFSEVEMLLDVLLTMNLSDCRVHSIRSTFKKIELSPLFQQHALLFPPKIETLSLVPNLDNIRAEEKSEIEEIKPEVEIKVDALRLKMPLSILENLEKSQKTVIGSFSSLYQTSKSFGFKPALKNSKAHLEDLFVLMKRHILHLDKPFHKEQLLSDVTALVSHGPLAIEQLLLAINCKTNNIKDQEGLKKAFSHDLWLSLNQSDLGDAFLPIDVIKAIKRINFGEILARKIGLMSKEHEEFKENSPLSTKSLLKAIYLWYLNPNCQNIHSILKAASDYFCMTLIICEKLQKTLRLNDKDSPREQRDLELKKQLEEFQKQLSLKQASLQVVSSSQEKLLDSPALKSLKETKDCLEAFLKRPLSIHVRKSAENLTYNLLSRLQGELLYHQDLPLKQLRLHYYEVRLTTYYIAEEFLYQILNYRGEVLDRKDIDHNLLYLVEKIGNLPLDKTTSIFLQNSKETRGILRYLFSYSPTDKDPQSISKGLQKTFKKATQTSSRFFALDEDSNSKEEGFDTVHTKLKESIKEQILQDIFTLKALVTQLAPPTLLET